MSGPTAAQVRSYGIAAGAACRRLGIAGADACRAYRRRVVREETGRGSLGELRTAGEYDAVMARLWSDAGDAERAVHYGLGPERRLVRTARVLAEQLMQLKGGVPGGAAAYVDGVLARAGIPAGSHWMDLAPARLAQLVSILDTERRRILRRMGAARLAFSDRVRYEVDGPVLVIHGVERGHYDGEGGCAVKGRRADCVRDYAPASPRSLDRWYKTHGAETPPPCVCSAARWRIYLAARRNPKRYRAAPDADALA